MTLDDFLSELDRHGADFAAWPDAVRATASALAMHEPSAMRALKAQAEVEAWLVESRAPSGAGAPVWLAEIARRPQDRSAPAVGGRRRLAAFAAAAACLCLGVTVGAAPHFAPEPSEVLAQALAGSAGVFDVG